MTNGAPAKKKGLSTLAWVAIGCAGLIVVTAIGVFGLGFFAVKKGKEMVAEAAGSESFSDMVDDFQENPTKKLAEVMIATNPDLELLSTDDAAGTITFVNNKTGEQATLNFEDIAEGRFSMTTDEGEYRLDASEGGEGGVTMTGPDGETRWGGAAALSDVPDWVPIYPRASSVQSTMHSATSDGETGLVVAQTSDAAQEVIDHYKAVFESAGWSIESQSMNTAGGQSFGTVNGTLDGRSVNVTATEQGDACQVSVHYNVKQ